MVTSTQFLPILLVDRGGVNVGTPVKKYSKKVNKNNNKGSMDEQKKNDVQTTAAILRTKQQRKS
jgi:hypothetical protein